MRQSLQLKSRLYVWRYHVSLWNKVDDVFGPFSTTNPNELPQTISDTSEKRLT